MWKIKSLRILKAVLKKYKKAKRLALSCINNYLVTGFKIV